MPARSGHVGSFRDIRSKMPNRNPEYGRHVASHSSQPSLRSAGAGTAMPVGPGAVVGSGERANAVGPCHG